MERKKRTINPIKAWREMSTSRRSEALSGYLFISPWLIGFTIFWAGPILASFLVSFTRWNIVMPPKWIGLKNYISIFTRDPEFLNALRVTMKYTLMYIPITTVVAILVALALNQKVRGVGIFRTLFYLPYVVPAVSAAMIFMWILHPTYGIVNLAIEFFGGTSINWFEDPQYALWGIIFISLWGVGGGAVIYLAGLQNIPLHLYDAAKVDGANNFQQFRHITLPMLTPIIFFQLVIELIGVFQTFTTPFVVSATKWKAGPIRELTFYLYYLYIKGWSSFRMGYASALSWILTLIILGITILVFRSSPFWVHYEAEKN
ncbi:MAG: sugar ABC transporter permease [Anaerolineales bacterium]|nr:sugar ABC transporter permease [Anaerolineales bacterium]